MHALIFIATASSQLQYKMYETVKTEREERGIILLRSSYERFAILITPSTTPSLASRMRKVCSWNRENGKPHQKSQGDDDSNACLKELVDIYCARAIKVHHLQGAVNIGQLTIGMQRLVDNRTAISKLLQRNNLIKPTHQTEAHQSHQHEKGGRLTPSPLVSKKRKICSNLFLCPYISSNIAPWIDLSSLSPLLREK